MKKTRQPGIRFDRVFLSKMKYDLPKMPPDKFSYKLNFINAYKIQKEGLIYTMTVQLYDRFEFEVTGIFSTIKGQENLSLEKFAKVNAPALLLPFIREIISNITSRTPLPYLLLPPINVFALTKKSKAGKTSK